MLTLMSVMNPVPQWIELLPVVDPGIPDGKGVQVKFPYLWWVECGF